MKNYYGEIVNSVKQQTVASLPLQIYKYTDTSKEKATEYPNIYLVATIFVADFFLSKCMEKGRDIIDECK